MGRILKFLEGKRTFILCALGGITVALRLGNVISDETAKSLMELLGFGSVAALRASKR